MQKDTVISKNKKLYLATFELISGQYGQIFYTAFYAKNKRGLNTQIHKYLENYYDKGNNTTIERDIYYYFNGEVAVKKHGWEEVADLKQVISKLLN